MNGSNLSEASTDELQGVEQAYPELFNHPVYQTMVREKRSSPFPDRTEEDLKFLEGENHRRHCQAAAALFLLFLTIAASVGIGLYYGLILPNEIQITEAKHERESEYFGMMRVLNLEWIETYNNPLTYKFKKLAADIEKQIDLSYRASDINNIYDYCKVVAFKPGSVIAEYEIFLHDYTFISVNKLISSQLAGQDLLDLKEKAFEVDADSIIIRPGQSASWEEGLKQLVGETKEPCNPSRILSMAQVECPVVLQYITMELVGITEKCSIYLDLIKCVRYVELLMGGQCNVGQITMALEAQSHWMIAHLNRFDPRQCTGGKSAVLTTLVPITMDTPCADANYIYHLSRYGCHAELSNIFQSTESIHKCSWLIELAECMARSVSKFDKNCHSSQAFYVLQQYKDYIFGNLLDLDIIACQASLYSGAKIPLAVLHTTSLVPPTLPKTLPTRPKTPPTTKRNMQQGTKPTTLPAQRPTKPTMPRSMKPVNLQPTTAAATPSNVVESTSLQPESNAQTCANLETVIQKANEFCSPVMLALLTETTLANKCSVYSDLLGCVSYFYFMFQYRCDADTIMSAFETAEGTSWTKSNLNGLDPLQCRVQDMIRIPTIGSFEPNPCNDPNVMEYLSKYVCKMEMTGVIIASALQCTNLIYIMNCMAAVIDTFGNACTIGDVCDTIEEHSTAIYGPGLTVNLTSCRNMMVPGMTYPSLLVADKCTSLFHLSNDSIGHCTMFTRAIMLGDPGVCNVYSALYACVERQERMIPLRCSKTSLDAILQRTLRVRGVPANTLSAISRCSDGYLTSTTRPDICIDPQLLSTMGKVMCGLVFQKANNPKYSMLAQLDECSRGLYYEECVALSVKQSGIGNCSNDDIKAGMTLSKSWLLTVSLPVNIDHCADTSVCGDQWKIMAALPVKCLSFLGGLNVTVVGQGAVCRLYLEALRCIQRELSAVSITCSMMALHNTGQLILAHIGSWASSLNVELCSEVVKNDSDYPDVCQDSSAVESLGSSICGSYLTVPGQNCSHFDLYLRCVHENIQFFHSPCTLDEITRSMRVQMASVMQKFPLLDSTCFDKQVISLDATATDAGAVCPTPAPAGSTTCVRECSGSEDCIDGKICCPFGCSLLCLMPTTG